MEVIEKIIPYSSKSDVFNFYPIGDIHLGSVECAENDVSRKVHQILNEEKSYIIGQGDYTECITKNDPRFDIRNLADWVEKDNIVESQRQRVNEIFKKASEEKRIIGLLTGNHEEEIHMRHDNDIIRNLCKDLNVPYGGYQCYVVLKFLKKGRGNFDTYIWHAWHGAGAAQTEGARLMRLMRLVNDIEADIYTMGHIHGAISTYTPDRLCYNVRTHKIESTKVVATLSGSWVKGFMQSTEERPLNPHYGEKKGYKPSRIGSPVIKITPFHHIVEVEI